MPTTPHIPRIAAVLAIGALAAAVAGPGASAQDGRTLTLKELEKGSTFVHVRNGHGPSRQANSAGDLLVFTNRVADGAGKVVGRVHDVCTTTVGSRDIGKSIVTCHGTLVTGDGMITFQTTRRLGTARGTGTITGGTDAYWNARGVFVAGTSDITINLEG
jgi:hypothetical protein